MKSRMERAIVEEEGARHMIVVKRLFKANKSSDFQVIRRNGPRWEESLQLKPRK